MRRSAFLAGICNKRIFMLASISSYQYHMASMPYSYHRYHVRHNTQVSNYVKPSIANRPALLCTDLLLLKNRSKTPQSRYLGLENNMPSLHWHSRQLARLYSVGQKWNSGEDQCACVCAYMVCGLGSGYVLQELHRKHTTDKTLSNLQTHREPWAASDGANRTAVACLV